MKKQISPPGSNTRVRCISVSIMMKTRLWLTISVILLLIALPVFGDDLTRIYGSVQRTGVNQVTLDNSQNDKEAVVVFREVNWPNPFAVYLSPGQTGVLKVPSRSYQIWYSLGYGWNKSENRFTREPEYYMRGGIFMPGEEGNIHVEKHALSRIPALFRYPDEFVGTMYDFSIDYPDWTWAESTISLYPVQYFEHLQIPIDESEFPLP